MQLLSRVAKDGGRRGPPRPIDGPAHPTTRRGGGHVGVWLRCGRILTGEIVRPGPYPPSEPYLRLEVPTACLGASLQKFQKIFLTLTPRLITANRPLANFAAQNRRPAGAITEIYFTYDVY